MTIATDELPKKAIIYCRVSSAKQRSKGTGLESQEHRCRQYAEAQNWDVEAVFPDDISGGGDFMNRPGMVALLAYLEAQQGRHDYVVIFDDLKRLARDAEFYRKLRRILKERNASVECLNFRIEETPEGKFIETIIAAQGELEREQNQRQVIQKMKARVEKGYWVFPAPRGYKYVKSKGQGKVLVRDEPLASILQEALEGYASGLFATQSEVQRFLSSKPVNFPRNSQGEVHPSRIGEILNRPIYAGLVEAKCWNVSRRKGNHEGLISVETYQKIQKRLTEVRKAPARKDIAEDFPLRGFVVCGDCGTPYRSAWSKGKFKKYPYYLCQTKGCASYGKSLRRADVEGQFEAILKNMRPSVQMVSLIKQMVIDIFKQRQEQASEINKARQRQLLAIEKKIENLTDRLIETSSSTAISAYERHIEKLENQKLLISEKLVIQDKNTPDLTQLLELPLKFLSNPWKIWNSGDIHLKKLVLRLAFSERLPYYRSEGYRTPKTTLPFNILEDFSMIKKEMVGQVGLEPTTRPL